MKRTLIYIYAFAVVLGLGGCARYDVTEVLLDRNDISLTVKGSAVFVYNSDKCQVAYNSERNEYRAMTDDASKYFVLEAHERLSSVGQELQADLKYTTERKTKSETDLTFTIEKISDSEGLVWLWCSSRKIGLVIKAF